MIPQYVVLSEAKRQATIRSQVSIRRNQSIYNSKKGHNSSFESDLFSSDSGNEKEYKIDDNTGGNNSKNTRKSKSTKRRGKGNNPYDQKSFSSAVTKKDGFPLDDKQLRMSHQTAQFIPLGNSIKNMDGATRRDQNAQLTINVHNMDDSKSPSKHKKVHSPVHMSLESLSANHNREPK